MNSSRNRKKQPEIVKSQLLRSAAEIAVKQGAHAVTLESVALHAGVSKGGLQYHFKSKQKLLDALFDELSADTANALHEEEVSDGQQYGREARAYLAVTNREASDSGTRDAWRVLFGVMMAEPTIRERWAVTLRSMNRPDPLPDKEAARLMICRLAAEGIWMSELLGSLEMTPSLRSEVLSQLEAMTLPSD